MSCQHPCQKVGWVSAVIKVHSAQKQSRASGSYLLCLRAYRKKKTQKGEEPAVCWAPSVPSGNSQARGRAQAAWRRPDLEAPTVAVVMGTGDTKTGAQGLEWPVLAWPPDTVYLQGLEKLPPTADQHACCPGGWGMPFLLFFSFRLTIKASLLHYLSH